MNFGCIIDCLMISLMSYKVVQKNEIEILYCKAHRFISLKIILNTSYT